MDQRKNTQGGCEITSKLYTDRYQQAGFFLRFRFGDRKEIL